MIVNTWHYIATHPIGSSQGAYVCNGYNMAMRDLLDMYAQCLRTGKS